MVLLVQLFFLKSHKSIFLFFYYLLLSTFSSLDQAQYDIIVARGQQSQYRLEKPRERGVDSGSPFAVGSIHASCHWQSPLGADVCMYSTRKNLDVKNLSFLVDCFLLTFEISTDGHSLIQGRFAASRFGGPPLRS